MDYLKLAYDSNPDSKVHGANMGPTWVLLAPGGSHVGPMNLAIWEAMGHLQLVQSVSFVLPLCI